MDIGILALQGAVQPHAKKLKDLGVTPREVRTPQELQGLAGIILPGGESSTMIHLLRLNQLWGPLGQFLDEKPSWGVCAGAILLARNVDHPKQASFGKLNLTAVRNAFGRQLESFIADVETTTNWKVPGKEGRLEGVFIRAPRFEELGADVEVLALWNGEPVFVRQAQTLASSFHPELSEKSLIHQYFVELCNQQQAKGNN